MALENNTPVFSFFQHKIIGADDVATVCMLYYSVVDVSSAKDIIGRRSGEKCQNVSRIKLDASSNKLQGHGSLQDLVAGRKYQFNLASEQGVGISEIWIAR